MIAPPPSKLRESTTIGRFRVEVWEERGELFRIHVLELRGREWEIVRGPFGTDTLDEAQSFAADIAEGLRERVRTWG